MHGSMVDLCERAHGPMGTELSASLAPPRLSPLRATRRSSLTVGNELATSAAAPIHSAIAAASARAPFSASEAAIAGGTVCTVGELLLATCCPLPSPGDVPLDTRSLER